MRIFYIQLRVKIIMLLLVTRSFLSGCFLEPRDLSPEEKEGYELYLTYCRQCHCLRSPKLHTADKWPAVVNKIKRFMPEKNKKMIDNQQEKAILRFLQGRARK